MKQYTTLFGNLEYVWVLGTYPTTRFRPAWPYIALCLPIVSVNTLLELPLFWLKPFLHLADGVRAGDEVVHEPSHPRRLPKILHLGRRKYRLPGFKPAITSYYDITI